MWNNTNNNHFGEMNPTNHKDVFGSPDSSYLSQLRGLLPRVSTRADTPQMQSPTGHQMRQNMNQLRASYPTNASSSPSKKPQPTYDFDSSATVMNSRSSTFAKQRSQSFIDREADMNKLRKSASFGFRSDNGGAMNSGMHHSFIDEPDVSRVNSLVKDVSSTGAGLYSSDQKHNAGNGVQLPAWDD
ncbi:hypothetical protein POM88_007947 [Heracleum sosnowskyi]|uniref:Uncharacterized protein n=1 Tax=Heracleum sosnowskyi TaxID=360622 RepID=A0AAD8J743_9APIA|nr:hypothetical protein POM88_007947 [Heracleum sosnowskyi]